MPEDVPLSLPLQRRFEQLLQSYSAIVRLQFPNLLRRFEPGGDYEPGIAVAVPQDLNPRQWCFTRRQDGEPLVRGFRTSAPSSFHPDAEVSREQMELGAKTCVWRQVSPVERLNPAGYARELVTQQLVDALRDGDLVESWHLVYQRAWTGLAILGTPISSRFGGLLNLDLAAPIDALTFKRAAVAFLIASGSLSPDSATRDLGDVIIPPAFLGNSRGKANLADLEFDLRRLDQMGHTVNGPFLPDPDLDYDDAMQQNGGQARFTWGYYSDAQLQLAAERSWVYAIDAYREMARVNFPLICDRMRLYRNLPISVDVRIDRTRKTHHWHDSNWAAYELRRLPGRRDPALPSTVTIRVFSNEASAWESAQAQAHAATDAEFPLRAGNCNVAKFFDPKDWRHDILKHLEQDFLAVWQSFPH